MRVFDFDKTIYDGDSTADFLKFCIKTHPKCIIYLFSAAIPGLLFVLRLYDKTRFKEKMYSFLRGLPDTSDAVERFWNTHEGKIKSFYSAEDDDIIISASPHFLLENICRRLGIKHLIASCVDEKTGKYTGVNCWGEEKVLRLNKYMAEYHIDEFYSDSLSDSPLAHLADNAYIVQKNKIIPWEEYENRK